MKVGYLRDCLALLVERTQSIPALSCSVCLQPLYELLKRERDRTKGQGPVIPSILLVHLYPDLVAKHRVVLHLQLLLQAKHRQGSLEEIWRVLARTT